MFPGYTPGTYRTSRAWSTATAAAPTLDGGESTRYARSSTADATATISAGAASAAPSTSSPDSGIDSRFDLPPVLVTCLVRHTDGQHRPLATPAVVERCLRDLQRRLHPWVPVERVFGTTMHATTPTQANTSAPAAGTFMAGSRVRLQLAKTTDIGAVVGGTSALHLLFYAVDEAESKPAALAQMAQDWRSTLTRNGEGDDCLVLLVHRDIIASAEAASRLAEEAQHSGAAAGAEQRSAPSPATAPAPAPAVSQARVDAAAAQVGRYYRELRDMKFSPQQIITYMPSETPTRLLERLRPAVMARGARLRHNFEACAAQKRELPLDPRIASSAGAAAAAASAARPPSPRPCWSVQGLWRCGYALAVFYLQYGLVVDARAVLERLFLEYFNSSDDYVFLRSPVATLQRLGRVPNLFDARGHAGWSQSKLGHPRGLDDAAEPLEGLLLVASAEMACSLLLGDAAAAMVRYHAFMQVTREKFDEWSAAEARALETVTEKKDSGGAAPTPSLRSATYQQFFLLQCYLSGLRLWWPTGGLCQPRRGEVGAAATAAAAALGGGGGGGGEERHSTHPASSLSLPLARLPSVHRSTDDSGAGRASPPLLRPLSSLAEAEADVAPVLDVAHVLSAADDALAPQRLDAGSDSGVRYSMTNPSFAVASGGASVHSLRFGGAMGSFGGRSGGERSATRLEAAEPVPDGTGADTADADADGLPQSHALLCGPELGFLLSGSAEETAQMAITYLVDLATATGLLAENMEAALLLPDSTQTDVHHTADADGVLSARALQQQRQRQLRRKCVEAATLLEHAKDALAAVAHDLGYSPFSHAIPRAGAAPSNAATDAAPSDSAAAATAFANVEELSSPEQALRLWRVLSAMAALALRLGEQRRREFHIYARLAMTLLIDHPSAAANIVAARLLPYVKRHGWRRIELFVRRLYVEACERLMLRAGLLANGGLAAAVATMTARASQTRLWRRVFHTSAAYALYRECVLVLLSNSGGDDGGGDGGRGGDVVADRGVAAAEDVVGSLDSRLFSLRTRAVWWRELLRIDALVMGIVFTGEPLEYPLEYFTSPMTVRVEHKTGAAEAGRSNDSVDTINETSATVPPGVLQVGVEDLVQITFSSVFSIDPLARPAFAGDDAAAEAADVASGVRFQLALESRKEWTDEEEAVHEVHIRDAAAVHFDAVTRRLRVSFDFPVCHAGVYRVRRLRLCNGSTWLAAYPQHTAAAAAGSSGHPDGGGIGGSSGGWASCLRALSWNASSTPRPMRVLVEPLYQPAGRAALLRVTEPRSSVHLRLTLPHEAHCFADSVDYVTLEVDLEDPLEIKSATADATHAITTAASAPPLDAAVARKAGARAAAAAAAECTCSFDLSSTDLRLPLSASAPVRGRHAPLHGSCHYAPLSVVNSGSSGALQRRASASSMAFHSLLPPLDDSANGDGVGGPADAPRVAAAAAAVVLGTPAAYRTRSATAAATRSALGTSFASLSVAGLGSSFAARAGQPTDALALSRRGAPLSTSPGEAHEPMHAGHTGQQLRYKSVFKSLRLGASLAASMSGVHADVATPTTATRGVGHSGRTTPRLEQLPECSGPEGQTGDERARRGPAVGGTPTASPLRAVAADMLELVLVHSEMAWQEDSASAAPSHGSRAAAAATAATTAARTVVPIHLGTYLANLPAPEVQVAAPRTTKDGTAASAATTLHTTSVLRAQSHRSADPLRETVIQFLPRHHDAAAAEAPPDVAVTHMRLRLPLLPLLTTSTTAAALASVRPGTVVSSRAGDDVGGGEDAAAPSAAVVAHQARISFTCVRGREPCTRTLHATLPFTAAVSFDYTFKHFQGRVYCLVRMQNKLTCTSLWLRGAVLRVLDAEPSYEIVRVCEVYNELLLTEWKPREELHILYELDLVASFHPAQPECAHRVQMEVFYSSWCSTFLTTSPEDRLVLRTMELPPTEATAESVEVIHSDVATHDDAAAAARETPAPHHADPRAVAPALHRSSLARSVSVESSRSASVAPITHTHRSASSGTNDDDDDGDPVGNGSVGSRGSGSDSVKSRTAASSAVHFNVVTLRHLEETVNTVWGPVATFRSKHLCVFSIVMHAESPWTMRFGAAVNYSAPPPTTPLTAATGGGGGPASRSAVHAAGAASATAHPSTTTAFAGSLHSAPASRASVSGGGGDGGGGGRPGGAATSLFGNAMVDQPSDVVFVAGEPVRFCVRLQPQAQNWPEDADMEETFFIRLKYNPAQWMVIGKQRDRRALSLMEEVTVYFNAVPLLPIASTAGGTTATPLPSRTAASDRAVRGAGAATGPGGRGGEDSDADDDDQEDEDGDLGAVRGGVAGRPQRRRSARPLAGHGVEDEGILQTPTVEMFWERKTPPHSHAAKGASSSPPAPTLVGEGATSERPPPTHADAVMGEAVLVDVVQFRTWVRVRKRGH
ncbi:hypothetical protein NESM_000329600 [Novymonas esmeraldas]|uniref:Uncharacterized protein n=1 Tax=Novymonas esmeraldas TaxID=1808958 RepID=A0AAW0EK72_9TRYP